MSRFVFCLRAVRNNIRTVPFVFVSLVFAIATAFASEAWVLRTDYKHEHISYDMIYSILMWTAIVLVVLFLFLMFMYNYWLRITEERNVPYKRMGAPSYILFAECFLEMLFITAVGCVLGLVFDSILNTFAPRSDYIQYLDLTLFFKTFGVILIDPALVLFLRLAYKQTVRLVDHINRKRGR